MNSCAPHDSPGTRHIRVAAFVPVRQRARADGWSAERQARFLVALARTRSVSAAARAAGMARETAYRLRKAPGGESFAAAWDAALGRHSGLRRKVTAEERLARALGGLVKPVVWRAGYAGIARKEDNSALLGLVARLDREPAGGCARGERSQSFDRDLVSTLPADRG